MQSLFAALMRFDHHQCRTLRRQQQHVPVMLWR